jgi:hypothetical protein
MVTTYRPVRMESTGWPKVQAAKTRTLVQERIIERPREELCEPERLCLAVKVNEYDFDVAAELPQYLAASAARWRKGVSVRGNGNPAKPPGAFGDTFEDGVTFRADG